MPWTRISVTDFGDAADKLAEFLTRSKRADTPVPNGSNVGNGVVFGASSAIDSVDETWTLVCTTGGGNGVGIFSVTGSVSGAQTDATVAEPYSNGLCSFTIIGGSVDFITFTPGSVSDPAPGNTGNGSLTDVLTGDGVVAETWTITATTTGPTATFSVVGSVSGAQADATSGTPYDNGKISFSISDGGTPYIVGDDFTFDIIRPDDFTFAIAAGTPTWEEQRGFRSDERLASIQPGSVSDPGAGNTGNGSLTGVLTIDGVVAETWTITATSTGPSATFSVVGSVSGGYAEATSGTPYDNGKVSFSISDGGTPYIVGDDFTFDTVRTVDTVIADAANVGNGTVGSMVGIASDQREGPETITLNCTTGGGDGVAIFDVDGSLTGDFGSDATAGTTYNNSEFEFLISTGGIEFEVGDKFTFETRPFEFILKGIGGGSDEIFVGYREETNGTTYFNWQVQGFTGYVAANDFDAQPGWELGIYSIQTNGTFDILIIENARRFIVIPIIGSTYGHIYLGWILPIATPSQWDYPLFKGGDSNDFDTLIGDSSKHEAWWIGPEYGDIYNNDAWDANSDIWPYDRYTIYKTEDGEFPLFPVTVINQTSGQKKIYGEAEGCFYVDADGGSVTVSDSVVVDEEFFLITQNINQVSDDNLMALRLE